ncbi:MoaC, Molybdenum cofactor biosynthesis enzyme, partial [Pyrenophora tritici-repentis]
MPGTDGHVKAAVKAARADHIRDIGMLKSALKQGITSRPLPPSMEEVRQKYGLDGPEFNGYWYRAADAELRHRTRTESAAVLERAERALQARLKEFGKGVTLTHEGLMAEARQLATQAAREKQAAPFKRHQMITMEIKKVLQEVTVPQEHVRVLKGLRSRISELEHIMERIAGKGLTADEASETYGYGLPGIDPRNKAQFMTGKEKPTLEEIENFQKMMQSSTSEPVPTKIQQIQHLLDMYRQQAADVEDETQRLKDIRIRREQVLSRRRELLEQMKAQKEKVKETERAAKAKKKGPARGDVDAILAEALRRQKKDTPETLPDRGVSELEGVEPIFQSVTQADEDTLSPIRKPGLESLRVLKPRETRDTAAKDENVLADPIMDKSDTYTAPTASTVSQPPKVNENIFPSTASDIFAVTESPPPKPYISPFLGLSTRPLHKPSNDLRLDVTPAGFVPIDENLVVTFEAGVPHLQAQVLEMRNRLKHAYPRIDSLPYDVWKSENRRTLQTWLRILVRKWQTRFDDVEKSGRVAKKAMRDVRVENVLDEMVRDHDLDNEAAERMAMRWYEIFGHRGSMTGDAEGRIDREELHAGGLDFLLHESEGVAEKAVVVGPLETKMPVVSSTVGPLETKMPEVSSSGGSVVNASSGTLSMLRVGGGRRMYSTTSQPPPSSTPNPNEKTTTPPSLPHLTPTGTAHMISVTPKPPTSRTAIATGKVSFTNATPLTLIHSNAAKKGDVLGVSRIAGIMAAKKCSDLVPLCHPIALTHVGVEVVTFGAGGEGGGSKDGGFGGVNIEAKVQCVGPTGVEMEALTAVMGAALSVVDMCKAVDKGQRIEDVRVVAKEGGR